MPGTKVAIGSLLSWAQVAASAHEVTSQRNLHVYIYMWYVYMLSSTYISNACHVLSGLAIWLRPTGAPFTPVSGFKPLPPPNYFLQPVTPVIAFLSALACGPNMRTATTQP